MALLFENICRVVVDERIIVYDTAGKLVNINRAAERMCTGSSRQDDPTSTSLLDRLYKAYEVSNQAGERLPQEDHPLAMSPQLTAFSDYFVRLQNRESETPKYLRFNGDPIYDQSGDLFLFAVSRT